MSFGLSTCSCGARTMPGRHVSFCREKAAAARMGETGCIQLGDWNYIPASATSMLVFRVTDLWNETGVGFITGTGPVGGQPTLQRRDRIDERHGILRVVPVGSGHGRPAARPTRRKSDGACSGAWPGR
jgi:hypothetical protein